MPMKPYYTAFPEDTRAFVARLQTAPLVLMLTMGKVASKSIGRSLEHFYPGCIVHCHGIQESGPCKPGQFGPDHFDERFRLAWQHAARGGEVKIISPVRESLRRNISDFFHNFHKYVGGVLPVQHYGMGKLEKLFYSRMPHLRHAYWFDTVLKPLTGVDVYQGGWNRVVPSLVFANRNWEVLVFRTETADGVKEDNIREFLGLDAFHLTNSNTAREKDYHDHYRRFKDFFQPKPGFLESLRETQYYQTFYPRIEAKKDLTFSSIEPMV